MIEEVRVEERMEGVTEEEKEVRGEKKFVCGDCGEACTSRNGLRSHRKKCLVNAAANMLNV